ncbi:MAG: V-type ATPase 116kDa subunit family protein [Treponema sp.]
MARTTEMRLIELMALKQDIRVVLEYLGKKGNFQFQTKVHTPDSQTSKKAEPEGNTERDIFDSLEQARVFLDVPDRTGDPCDCKSPTAEDRTESAKLLALVEDLKTRVNDAVTEAKHVNDAYKEALAFSNLKASYSELEHLSFLSLRIGKIDPNLFDALKDAVGARAVVVSLGDDKSRILAASSKKGRFALDTELKKFNFVKMDIPEDFKGIPDDILASLKKQNIESAEKVAVVDEERKNFAETHKSLLLSLLGSFSVSMQIQETLSRLESTELVYRLTGWLPARDCSSLMKDLDQLTEGRIAIREYLPSEVPSVINGKEQVPVQLHHGKIVSSFERMIFSYGAPVYGTIDPTPFVALFFTLLFGIMFGDCGQGLVIFILGILLYKNILKMGGYNKSAIVFMAVGASSMVMGLLTGEFFATEKPLEPFAYWVTGLFGTPHAPIVKLMPSSSNTTAMFVMFGIAVGIGFIINTLGLLINIINKFSMRKIGEALFGKTGLAGACFFWYVIAMVIRIIVFKHTVALYDWIIIAVTLFFSAFGKPFARIIDKKHPVAEDGTMVMVISGVIELIEVISNYFSNTVSFLRVGAFALAHAVLDYIILVMTKISGPVGGVFVMIIGNAIVVTLEGMIVAIQVVRLQYYEFFSKFFNETGSEFKPFRFEYGKKNA